MVMLNSEVVEALEKAKFREILLGEDGYFLPDTTYRNSHNVLLVMFVLLNWFKNINSKTSVANTLEATIYELAKAEPWECFDILLAYTITARDNNLTLPINFSSIMRELRRHLNASNSPIRDCEKSLKDLERRFRDVGIDAND